MHEIGFLDAEELIEALSKELGIKVSYKCAKKLLEEFDKDGNGKFDISEYAMMKVSIVCCHGKNNKS